MKTPQARARALSSNDLGRALKRLRDGSGEATEIAASCVALCPTVPYATRTRLLRDLGVLGWLSDLQSGDPGRLARRSPAFRDMTSTEALLQPATSDESSVSEPTTTQPASLDAPPVKSPWGTRQTRDAREFRTITSDQVVAIHAALVEDFATTPDPIFPPGVKHPELLESAVGRQFTSLGGESKYKTMGYMAAALFYGLALNHPFHNGNKRAAIVALLCLADANDLTVTATQLELYDFVLAVVT